jgi:hypothetical protein
VPVVVVAGGGRPSDSPQLLSRSPPYPARQLTGSRGPGGRARRGKERGALCSPSSRWRSVGGSSIMVAPEAFEIVRRCEPVGICSTTLLRFV